MNRLLIVALGFGPTYKKRLLDNIKNNDGYDLYDVLIITDDIEYWDEIKNKNNIFVEHIDDLRKDHQWSVENEKLPQEKRDDVKYAKEIIENNFKFPTLLHRFAFIWKMAENYDGFLWLNTDVTPIKNDEEFKKIEEYFYDKKLSSNCFGLDIDIPKYKMILSPGSGKYDDYHQPFLLEYAKKINDKYKITDKEVKFDFNVFDGNFVTFNFPNKTYYVDFFNLLNNILKEYFENKKEYFFLGTHTIWLNHQEFITSIAFNLMDGIMIPTNVCNGLGNQTIKINCFPEDRFWSWGWECDINEGQDGFVKKNYNKLKEFYENRAQKFNY